MSQSSIIRTAQSDTPSIKPNNIRASTLIPVFEVILANFRARLQRIPHRIPVIHHQADVMNTRRVVFTIALATEEDGVASTAVRPLDFPISHGQPSEKKGTKRFKEGFTCTSASTRWRNTCSG